MSLDLCAVDPRNEIQADAGHPLLLAQKIVVAAQMASMLSCCQENVFVAFEAFVANTVLAD